MAGRPAKKKKKKKKKKTASQRTKDRAASLSSAMLESFAGR
jgi:hypothetical protein